MVRRAYMMASLEQYFALLINFTVLVIVARILTPGEMVRMTLRKEQLLPHARGRELSVEVAP